MIIDNYSRNNRPKEGKMRYDEFEDKLKATGKAALSLLVALVDLIAYTLKVLYELLMERIEQHREVR
jgi:hypothetical protein